MTEKHHVAIVIDVEQPFRRRLDVLDGIRQVAQKADWETTLIPVADMALAGQRVGCYDGLVGRIGRSLALQAKRRRIPTVNVWLNTDATGLPGVFPDWRGAATMATQHLLSRGFRKLAYVGFRDELRVEMQVAGYRHLAQDLAMRHSVHLLDRSYSRSLPVWQAFSSQLDALIASWDLQTGVCVSDDFLGRFIVDRCQQLGFQVPRDIAVVSMENETLVCECTSPTLSSVDVGYKRIGMQAAWLLETWMRGDSSAGELTLLPPRAIVERQSTDAFGVRDVVVADCLRFIAAHAHRPLSVDDVAARACLSRRTLERRFREIVCRTVAEEITRARIEKAKQQLFELDLPIKTVARRSGFRDSSQMCAVFQRELGQSPGQFRKIHAVRCPS